ncbi:Mediator of RNA polymerase II transcription subunit 16, partial [Dissostichus eleginoides]
TGPPRVLWQIARAFRAPSPVWVPIHLSSPDRPLNQRCRGGAGGELRTWEIIQSQSSSGWDTAMSITRGGGRVYSTTL